MSALAAASLGVQGGGFLRKRRFAILAVLLACNIGLTAVFALAHFGASPRAAAGFNANAWYAVFVSSQNQEAFVGHVTEADSSDITMRDIYYLTFEAKDAAGKPIANPRNEDIQPVIKKLGQEVYGPKDFVKVNRLNLRYYTELRDDSKVVKAISAFEQAAPRPSPSK